MPINASQVSKLEIRVCTIVYETNIEKLLKKTFTRHCSDKTLQLHITNV